MNKKLVNYLDQKKCFKLICGAGNENYDEIKKLCALYSKAGCKFVDVNASIDAVKAAKEGFKISGKEEECFICVSIGTKGDSHMSKCRINADKCNQCRICLSVCKQNAVVNKNNSYYIEEFKCIGCQKCLNICSSSAIESYSKNLSLSQALPPIIAEGIDCIEYHATSSSEKEIMEGWNTIVKMYDGVLSVSINRSKMGDENLINLLKKMKDCCNNPFMVQADGLPMSGGENTYRATLQAISIADIIERAKITPYIIMSGGTNEKTIELAKLCGLEIAGFAAGSYARQIVKKYIDRADILHNATIYNEASNIAKRLVDLV